MTDQGELLVTEVTATTPSQEMQLLRELATDDRVSVEKLAALMQLHERAEARDWRRNSTRQLSARHLWRCRESSNVAASTWARGAHGVCSIRGR